MKKATLKIVRPYIPSMVNRTEKWFKNKASEGLRLVDYHHWVFEFQKQAPYQCEYLMYSGFDASKGIMFDYYMAKDKYARTNAVLNKKSVGIFEVDIKKIDADYYRFVNLRNSFYYSHYKMLTIIWLIIVMILGLMCFHTALVSYLLFPCLFPMIYALVSLLVLRRDMHKLRIEQFYNQN